MMMNDGNWGESPTGFFRIVKYDNLPRNMNITSTMIIWNSGFGV
jgi:hypothetical protein